MECSKARLLITSGIDPKEEKQANKTQQHENRINTFETIARKWHTDRAKHPDKWCGVVIVFA